MVKASFKKLASLELEEQILNVGSIVAIAGIFLPWVGGEWLGGDSVTYAGFGFYTGYIGLLILGLHVFILLITLVPLSGGTILIRKENKNWIRLYASSLATILTGAALSVIANTILDFARMEIRFGIYVSLIGSLITNLYAFLRYQEQKQNEVRELFHYPNRKTSSHETGSSRSITPPQAEAEEHRTFSSPIRR
jgi:hypothetical protein